MCNTRLQYFTGTAQCTSPIDSLHEFTYLGKILSSTTPITAIKVQETTAKTFFGRGAIAERVELIAQTRRRELLIDRFTALSFCLYLCVWSIWS